MSGALLVSRICNGWICDGVLLAPQWADHFGAITKQGPEHERILTTVNALEIGQEITIGGRTYTKVKIL